jgi:hypothetical protein
MLISSFVPHSHFVQEVVEARAWEVTPPAPALARRSHPGSDPSSSGRPDHLRPSPHTFTTANAGVSGILKREEAQAKQTDESLQAAFSDLNTLMVRLQGGRGEKKLIA